MIRALLLAAVAFSLGVGASFAQPATPELRNTVKANQGHERTILELRGKVRRLVVQRDRARRKVRRQYLTISRQRNHLRRAARSYGSIHNMISVAAVAYGQSSGMLLRKAECESHLWPYARNASSGASGLFQFLPSTWRSTPFGGFSIFDPFAQALAAGWMHARGRGSEWVCR